MKIFKIEEMTKGWFVGKFVPTVYSTNDVEVAIKKYDIGFSEERHYHRLATELTVIINGKVRMNGKEFNEGDIIVIEPFEDTDFVAIKDTISVVVKIPGVNNDKYVGAYHND